jgi:hypothetical protein
MAEKRKRRTREEFDERLRLVLGKIPTAVDDAGAEPEATAIAPPTELHRWNRIVSGTIKGSDTSATG